MSSPRFAPTLLALVAMALFAGSAVADEAASPGLQDPPLIEDVTTNAPEPNTTLLAGLAGMVLLLFALRRK